MGICTPQEGTQECQTLKNPPITLLPGLSHRARLGIFPLHFFSLAFHLSQVYIICVNTIQET